MSRATYTLRVHRAGHEIGRVRVRADSIRHAYERVRTERPDHARDQLICCGIQEAKR